MTRSAAPAQLMLAAWQHAQAALDEGDFDSAETHLSRALLAAHALDDPLAGPIRDAERMVVRLRELAKQRAYHRSGLELAERAMDEVRGELRSLFARAPDELRSFLGKADAAHRDGRAGAAEVRAENRFEVGMLTIHVLGALRITLNGRQVERCASSRGRALFAYLATHRHEVVPRDVLMDAFWPDAAPASARNSLNVALHNLRRCFKAIGDVPVVLFRDGGYSLNPALAVWLDVEAFTRHVEQGERREREGNPDAALREYEAAAAAYGGDFLADTSYEEWTTLPRERLRLRYLDVLDRLSAIHMNRGALGASIALCQLILARDPCREDIHRRVMCCYARQHQYPSAVRQYQICVEVLNRELGVAPDAATTMLCERIRRHEDV